MIDIRRRLARLAVGAAFAVSAAAAVPVPAPAQQPSATIGTFEDWSAFEASEGGNPVCYIGAEPKKEEGDYTQRGETFVLVTHRPAEDAYDVVSVNAGYPYKEGSETTVAIGDDTFNLFTDGRRAWAYDGEQDRALVRAMKGGLTMVIKGTSARGTLTTDTYSLRGFTAAYEASRQACNAG